MTARFLIVHLVLATEAVVDRTVAIVVMRQMTDLVEAMDVVELMVEAGGG